MTSRLGSITWECYSFAVVDDLLTEALSAKTRIYSAAYIMPSGNSAFGYGAKHRNHLRLLEQMMEDEVPYQIAGAPDMKQAFELLRSYPTIGNFLGYQFVTDLNYSEICDFTEMEFVVPGTRSAGRRPQVLQRSRRPQRDRHHQTCHGPAGAGVRTAGVAVPFPCGEGPSN